jgi:hypothetical protein
MDDLVDLPAALAALAAAGISDLTYSTFWQAVGAGRIPAQRLGRFWRIRRADLPVVIRHFQDREAHPPTAT